MIAERETGRTVASTLQGEVVAMGIDQNAMAHIMNVLTDLYSDPELAIVREYSTNALDAHIEAGVTRPIEVTTPSPLSPFLRIKDHGVGLNADDIRTIYSQYGNSTKRSTNDQVGMLGLGCKSALTYTDNFVVVSVKDGERVEVSIERNAEGAGVMKMPTVEESEEPNGTEVIISAKAINKISAIAAHFFSFWKPGTVLLNGAEPARIKGLDLYEDGRYIVIDGATDYVVMGNVPYPVTSDSPVKIRHDLPRGYRLNKSIAAFVGIGDVNFPPSRESLMGTAKTKETLKRIERDVKAGVEKAVQREIESAPTSREAVQAYIKWAELLGGYQSASAYRYKGMWLPQTFTPATKFEVTPRRWASTNKAGMLVTDNSTYKLSASDIEDSYPVGRWEHTLFFYGYDAKAVTPSQKRKMMKYVEDNSITDIKRFVLIADKPDVQQTAWLGADNIIPWADIKAIKLPAANTTATWSSGRLPGSYDLYDETGHRRGVAGDDIDQSKPIFWTPQTERDASYYAHVFRKHYPNGFYVVILAANRVGKFQRILPASKTAKEAVKDLWTQASAKFTPEQLLALHLNDKNIVRQFTPLYGKNVDDPAIREAIRVCRTDIKSVVATRQEFASLVDVNTLSAVQWSNPLRSYPLYTAMRDAEHNSYSASRAKGCESEDMVLYLNTKYNSIKGA